MTLFWAAVTGGVIGAALGAVAGVVGARVSVVTLKRASHTLPSDTRITHRARVTVVARTGVGLRGPLARGRHHQTNLAAVSWVGYAVVDTGAVDLTLIVGATRCGIVAVHTRAAYAAVGCARVPVVAVCGALLRRVRTCVGHYRVVIVGVL